MTDTPTAADFKALAARLEQVLKLRALPFGMKLCATVDDMAAVPRIRRPQAVTRWTSWWARPPGWAGRWA